MTASELEGDAPLWAALGRARRPPAPSPYFTRRVLREIALLDEAAPAWQRWLRDVFTRRRPGVLTGAACAVLLTAAGAGLLPLHRHHHRRAQQRPAPAAEAGRNPGAPADSSALPAAESLPEGDLGVITELDELLDSNENRLWLDDDTTS